MALFIHSILDQNNNGQKTGGHHQASKRPTNQKKTNRKKGKDHIEYRYSKKEKKRIDYIHFHHRFHYVKNIVK